MLEFSVGVDWWTSLTLVLTSSVSTDMTDIVQLLPLVLLVLYFHSMQTTVGYRGRRIKDPWWEPRVIKCSVCLSLYQVRMQPPYLPPYLPLYLPPSLPTYLPTYLPPYPPTYLPLYLPPYLPTHLPTYLSNVPSV